MTIKTDQLQGDTVGPTPVDNVLQGAAKAWVAFVGTGTVAILDSFNVSSITDTAVGQYEVNFATPRSAVNYATHTTADNVFCWAGSPTVNKVNVAVRQSNDTFIDTGYVCVTIHGD
ncbi:MAG TPA: hypothetical protein V6D20_18780 [Candidatus Obscuribacterales bacterium]